MTGTLYGSLGVMELGDLVIGGPPSYAFYEGADVYFGLFTTLPDNLGAGGVESSQARIAVTRWRPASNTRRTNVAAISAEMTVDVDAVGWGFWDASSGGTLLAFGEFDIGLAQLADGETLNISAAYLWIEAEDAEAEFSPPTTEDYCQVLKQLLPQGHAWRLKPDGVFEKLICALGLEFSRVERRMRDLIRESDVRESYELLEDWERLLGLPDCAETPATTAARQAAAHAKLTARSSGNEPFFLAMAARLGYPAAEIRREYDPFLCTSNCDHSLRGWDGSWGVTWTLVANATGPNDDTLECMVRAYAQAHEIVLFEYP